MKVGHLSVWTRKKNDGETQQSILYYTTKSIWEIKLQELVFSIFYTASSILFALMNWVLLVPGEPIWEELKMPGKPAVQIHEMLGTEIKMLHRRHWWVSEGI